VWQELFVLAYRYLRGRGLSHADAEDLAQDVLLATYENLDGIEPGRLQAWVRAVARNRHIDWLRRHSRAVPVAEVPETADSQGDPVLSALLAGDATEATRLLSLLAPADRQLLELRYLEDRTVEEVATTLGSSVNTAKVGLFRARKRLRAAVDRGRS
jgi:RNA polymerase sigma-70 factor (ECF subfamily)